MEMEILSKKTKLEKEGIWIVFAHRRAGFYKLHWKRLNPVKGLLTYNYVEPHGLTTTWK